MSYNVKINQYLDSVQASFFGPKYSKENQLAFGNTMKSMERNDILAKARENALKRVTDAWEIDKEIDASIQERRTDYKTREAQNLEYSKIVLEKEEALANLRAEYGIEPDSDEEKDLQILRRGFDEYAGLGEANFTEEEAARFGELLLSKHTDYQTEALKIDAEGRHFKKLIYDNIKIMKDDVSDIRAINEERLKSHGMLDAQKDAEDIMDNAHAQVMGMMLEDVKDNIDEAAKEADDKLKENQEKADEEEARETEAKIERLEKEAMLLNSQEAAKEAEMERKKADSDVTLDTDLINIAGDFNEATGISTELSNIKANLRLLEADLKGIKVNDQA